MVLSYYGGFVKKNNLLDLTKTTIKGTTAYHIKETLKTLGFESKGISCTLEDINKDNIIKIQQTSSKYGLYNSFTRYIDLEKKLNTNLLNNVIAIE